MTCADGIRRLGFRRWYERQLIESHACLVTGFLSLILALACVEEFSVRGPAAKVLLMTAVIVGAGGLCMAAWTRYRAMLDRAELLAEQSVCGQCGIYGVLRVLASGLDASAPEPDAQPGGESTSVQCRKCGHRWVMNTRCMSG